MIELTDGDVFTAERELHKQSLRDKSPALQKLEELKKFDVHPKTLSELKEIRSKWLKIDPVDSEVLDIILSASCDRRIKGDPTWLFVVAVSGWTKTEDLRSIGDLPGAYTLDTLTSKTLISGKVEKNEDGDLVPIGGILKHLDDKCLIIKDFTGVLSMRPDERDGIYSDLRLAFDGKLEKAYGTRDTPIRVISSFGCVAAVTPAIDKYVKQTIVLGERFLKVRYHAIDRVGVTRKALRNLGNEDEMRLTIRNATTNYMASLDFKTPVTVAEEYLDCLEYVSLYAAIMRTHVFSKSFRGDLVELETPEVEAPTRLSKQLLKLGQLLTIIRQRTEYSDSEHKTLCRVAKDCGVPVRQTIVDYLLKHPEGVLIQDVANHVNMAWRTASSHLQKMMALEIVTDAKDGAWMITPKFMNIIKMGGLYDVSNIKITTLDGKPSPTASPVSEKMEAVYKCVESSIATTPEDVEREVGISLEGAKALLKTLEKDSRVYQQPPGYYNVGNQTC